jgi:hypothetical protein
VRFSKRFTDHMSYSARRSQNDLCARYYRVLMTEDFLVIVGVSAKINHFDAW